MPLCNSTLGGPQIDRFIYSCCFCRTLGREDGMETVLFPYGGLCSLKLCVFLVNYVPAVATYLGGYKMEGKDTWTGWHCKMVGS
jgi:hypothetical protein